MRAMTHERRSEAPDTVSAHAQLSLVSLHSCFTTPRSE